MEKSSGVELGKLWETIPGKQKVEIVKQVLTCQKKLTSSHFPQHGSLYYANDLQHVDSSHIIDDDGAASSRFAVGPTTSRSFFDHGRDRVDVHLGPCMSPAFAMVSSVYLMAAC